MYHVNHDGADAGGPFALVGIAGHHQDFLIRTGPGKRLRHLDTIHLRHLNIGQNKIKALQIADKGLKSDLSILGLHDVMRINFKRPGNKGPNRIIVLNKQNASQLCVSCNNADKGQFPKGEGGIHAIADNEFVGTLETDEISLDAGLALGGFVQKRDDGYLVGAP